MKCGLCQFEFNEDSAAKSACKGCLKFGTCRLVKCPKCGYEMPPEPKWIKKLKEKFRKGK